jgi:PAS domain S-box-containing protein
MQENNGMEDHEKSREQLLDELKALRQRTGELETATLACRTIEQKYHHSEALYRKLVETMTDGLVVRDSDGLIVYANPRLCEMWECPYDELIGQRMEYFLDEENAPIFAEQMRKRRKGIYEPYEITWTRTKGRKITTHMAPKSIFDSDGNFINSFAVMTDISELKKIQEQLGSQTLELKRSNAELEQFAYVSSHDLQEPLRKIQAFGNRLKTKCGDQLDERGLDYLERMQNAAKRMQTLISDLLMFSRVTTKAQPFSMVDCNEVLRNVLSNLMIMTEQTQAEINWEKLPVLEADATQINQLLQNIILNALKFHQENVPPIVNISTRTIERQVGGQSISFFQILIEDNGIGFDEKYLDRIFGVFQRLHGRNVYEGTGIGLAVCKKIVDRHNGRITAESAPGKGATFIITLPARQMERENE